MGPPKTHTHPPPPQVTTCLHTEAKVVERAEKCQNPESWQVLNVPERYMRASECACLRSSASPTPFPTPALSTTRPRCRCGQTQTWRRTHRHRFLVSACYAPPPLPSAPTYERRGLRQHRAASAGVGAGDFVTFAKAADLRSPSNSDRCSPTTEAVGCLGRQMPRESGLARGLSRRPRAGQGLPAGPVAPGPGRACRPTAFATVPSQDQRPRCAGEGVAGGAPSFYFVRLFLLGRFEIPRTFRPF